MAKIENTLLKTILANYRMLPMNDDNTSSFIGDVFQRIDTYRIKVVGLADEGSATDVPANPTVHESYCHTFYRMLGLPVLSPLIGDFYNPGYYAPNLNDYAKVRKNVDNNQGSLSDIEKTRELVSSTNMSKYLSQDDSARTYKIEMLKNPRSVIVMKEAANAFEIDKQIETIKGRDSKFKTVQHILRPFRCNAYLAPVDKVLVPKKNLAAPFYKAVVNEQIEVYDQTYLETVCRIRFSTKAKKAQATDGLDLLDKALKSIQIGGSNVFQGVIGKQSVLETYILNVLVNNLIQLSLDYASKTKEYKSLASRYDPINNEVTALDGELLVLEQLKLWYESVQSYLPSDMHNSGGITVETSNPDNGVLTPSFISLISSPIKKLDQQINEKKEKKSKHIGEINSLSSDMFYMTGEVYGIGALEIMALMIAFWSISQESLLSMLDKPSFDRLYNNHPYLRNELVLARYNLEDKAPTKDIKEVMNEFDTVVYNLLSLADSIIEHSYMNTES